MVVCGDGEYIIYTALAWRNRSFGSALEFVWSSDGEYAVRESTSKIKIFSKSFQVQICPSKHLFQLFYDLHLLSFDLSHDVLLKYSNPIPPAPLCAFCFKLSTFNELHLTKLGK